MPAPEKPDQGQSQGAVKVVANGILHLKRGKDGLELHVYRDSKDAVSRGVKANFEKGPKQKGYCNTSITKNVVTCSPISCDGTCQVWGGQADGDLGDLGKPPVTIKEDWVAYCYCPG